MFSDRKSIEPEKRHRKSPQCIVSVHLTRVGIDQNNAFAYVYFWGYSESVGEISFSWILQNSEGVWKTIGGIHTVSVSLLTF